MMNLSILLLNHFHLATAFPMLLAVVLVIYQNILLPSCQRNPPLGHLIPQVQTIYKQHLITPQLLH
uniref:Uncharacterized protein n=1 Tax=Rhizophora mucronata TaxID=61149 RepID=A0A2P2QAE9_RHIMU